MEEPDAEKPILPVAAQLVLVAGMDKAARIYTEFHAGEYEAGILQLIRAISAELTSGVPEDAEVKIVLTTGTLHCPLEMVALMAAACKQQLDAVVTYARLSPADRGDYGRGR